jgi:hypothetical protein
MDLPIFYKIGNIFILFLFLEIFITCHCSVCDCGFMSFATNVVYIVGFEVITAVVMKNYVI